MGGGRIPGPPGCGLRPESCTGRKCGSRQRCVRLERAPEASAAHATAWAASSRLHARKVRWAAALKLRIRLGRVLLFETVLEIQNSVFKGSRARCGCRRGARPGSTWVPTWFEWVWVGAMGVGLRPVGRTPPGFDSSQVPVLFRLFASWRDGACGPFPGQRGTIGP